MKTFAIEDATQFRADGPHSLTSARYARDLNEVKAYGVATGSLRSQAQTNIGLFYVENPALQFGRNVRTIAIARNLSLVDAARFYAQVFVTVADSLITAWNSKFFYNAWRPTTAIRQADIDDNPRTEADPGWLPLATTPCHPEYPAAHGAGTGGLAYAVQEISGTRHIAVTLSSTSVPTIQPLASRTFATTDDLVDDVIAGRIYGGMHFRSSGEDGARIARHVARYVAKHYFRRVHGDDDRDGDRDDDRDRGGDDDRDPGRGDASR